MELLFQASGIEDILNSETALSGLKGALDQLKKDSDQFEESNQKTTKSMMDMFAQSELLGKLADSGRKVLDSLMDCVDASAQFETSLAKLSTIADTSSVSMNTLSSELLDLSNDTGVAASSLTESAYQAISASVDTASAVDFVAQANELAVGGFTSTETAVDVLSTAINAYGLEVSQAGQLSDYLITTQNLGKTSVDELAQSVGKVIPLASAYNVEMDNLSSAYAVLTANGIATAETGTYLKSMFTELADSGSEVAGILQDETGMSFSELSESGYSLGDVLAVIGESVGNDSTAFSNLWSSSEAGVGALSLLNAGTEKYNSVLNEMQNSTGAASQAYDAMTNTAEFAEQRMTNSANNLKIAVGDSLLDTFTGFNNVLADGLNWITEFAQEHETLVAGLTSGVAVAALLVIGLAGLGMAITAVTAATAALNLTTGGLLLAIGGIATAVGFLVSVFASGEDEVEDYNGTLSECRTEIEQTELALAKAKERYGENSDVVKNLESDLETLNAQYEKGGGAVEEFNQQINAATESLHEMSTAQSDAMTAIDNTQVQGLRAVSMLEALSGKAQLTSGDLDLMSSYADYLNDTFNCDIVVNYDTGELTGFDPTTVTKSIIDAANDNKVQQSIDYLTSTDFTSGYIEAFKQYDELMLKRSNLQKEYDQLYKNADYDTFVYDGRFGEVERELQSTNDELETAKSLLGEYDAELDKYGAAAEESGLSTDLFRKSLRETAKSGNELISMAEESADALTEQEEGYSKAQEAITAYNDQLYDLCNAYDEAYKASLESIEGQYALWDDVEDIQAKSADSIISALNSQNEYWTQYNDNLSILQERSSGIEGLGDMLSSMADGSEDSAAALAGLATASDEELATAVEAWQNLKQNQDDTAQNMASVQTQFESALSNIRGDMDDFVSGMDKESEAYAAATSTMDGFIRGIHDKMSEAQTALNSLTITASRVANINITAPVQKNAKGTTNAEDAFIAGESGAELILGMGGSTVFPASETQKIINAVADYADFSGGYTPQNTASYSSNTVTTFAPVFYLTQYGGMSKANQKQAKHWMKQIVDDAFASVGRTNPALYVI